MGTFLRSCRDTSPAESVLLMYLVAITIALRGSANAEVGAQQQQHDIKYGNMEGQTFDKPDTIVITAGFRHPPTAGLPPGPSPLDTLPAGLVSKKQQAIHQAIMVRFEFADRLSSSTQAAGAGDVLLASRVLKTQLVEMVLHLGFGDNNYAGVTSDSVEYVILTLQEPDTAGAISGLSVSSLPSSPASPAPPSVPPPPSPPPSAVYFLEGTVVFQASVQLGEVHMAAERICAAIILESTANTSSSSSTNTSTNTNTESNRTTLEAGGYSMVLVLAKSERIAGAMPHGMQAVDVFLPPSHFNHSPTDANNDGKTKTGRKRGDASEGGVAEAAAAVKSTVRTVAATIAAFLGGGIFALFAIRATYRRRQGRKDASGAADGANNGPDFSRFAFEEPQEPSPKTILPSLQQTGAFGELGEGPATPNGGESQWEYDEIDLQTSNWKLQESTPSPPRQSHGRGGSGGSNSGVGAQSTPPCAGSPMTPVNISPVTSAPLAWGQGVAALQDSPVLSSKLGAVNVIANV